MEIVHGGQGLKAELAAKITAAERKEQPDPPWNVGDEWWELSEAELQVFGFTSDDWPRMALTWECWECFTKISSSDEFSFDLIDAARAAYPEWADDHDPNNYFLALAKAFGGLSNRLAYAVMRKVDAGFLRSRLLNFADGR